MPLYVKLLDPRATVPTCAHPGEDLAYDLYMLDQAVVLKPWSVTKVHTGIAAQHRRAVPNTGYFPRSEYRHITDGLLLRDRSSMASMGIFITGGVIDAGYTGEIIVLMTNNHDCETPLVAGQKIAQMIPIPVLTHEDVATVEELDGKRGANGFGSTGR